MFRWERPQVNFGGRYGGGGLRSPQHGGSQPHDGVAQTETNTWAAGGSAGAMAAGTATTLDSSDGSGRSTGGRGGCGRSGGGVGRCARERNDGTGCEGRGDGGGENGDGVGGTHRGGGPGGTTESDDDGGRRDDGGRGGASATAFAGWAQWKRQGRGLQREGASTSDGKRRADAARARRTQLDGERLIPQPGPPKRRKRHAQGATDTGEGRITVATLNAPGIHVVRCDARWR